MTNGRQAKKVGDWGEQKAIEYLQQQGITVLARNFRARHGEIDIVAQEGRTLCFVEVKTCRSSSFGEPETWVTPRKQRRIISAARAYRLQHGLDEIDCRYDIITLRWHNGALSINYLRDAFWVDEDIN